MDELAREAAEAIARLGDCTEGTWQERLEALLEAGKECSLGFDEVMGWLGVETEC